MFSRIFSYSSTIFMLLANWFALVFVLTLSLDLPYKNYAREVSAFVIILLIVVAITPIPSIFFRFRGTPVSKYPRLARLFNETCEACGVSRDLFIVRITKKSNDLNGFISRNVVVLHDTLTGISDNEVKAIIAHEIGHYIARDSYLTMIVYCAGLPVYIISNVLALLANAFALFCKIPVIGYFFLVLNLSFAVFSFMIEIIMRVPILIYLYAARHREYNADAFAARHGFSAGLYGFLERFADGVSTNLLDSHPAPHKRMKKIQLANE